LSSSGTAIRALSDAAASTLGALASSGLANQVQTLAGVSSLSLMTSSLVTKSLASVGVSSLGALSSYATVQPPYVATAAGVLGGLSSTAAAIFGAPSYPISPAFYIQAASRIFYVRAPARPFYAAAPLRSFYVRMNPNLNLIPSFSQLDPLEETQLTFDGTLLLNGATFTGTPSVTVETVSGSDNPPSLQLTGVIITSEQTAVNGVTIAAGAAIQMNAATPTFNSRYLIRVTCETSNPDQTWTQRAFLPATSQ
jgi:hypothetical protein